jgi:hypothetical protein
LFFLVAVLHDKSHQGWKGRRMAKDHEKELKDIIGQLACPKDFQCYEQGFENLCKAEDVGLETFLECLEKRPHECPFSIPYARVFYCSCPLRVYIAKELKK